LIGPGDAGKWTPERGDEEFGGRFVRIFANEVQEGDIFLLRSGMSKIKAIDLVAGAYSYLDQFDDVNGWDLQHGRRVRWLGIDHEWPDQVFGANPPRLSRSLNPRVIEFAYGFLKSEPSDWRQRSLQELPPPEPPLEEPPGELADLVAEAKDLLPLYWNREEFPNLPSESELVAHFVVPCFRALGWQNRLLGVEWHGIDLVVFERLPRLQENVRFVVEVKRLGAGIEGAREQAKGYVASLGSPKDIIVTDGIRYRLYSAGDEFHAKCYANLWNMKRAAVKFFDYVRRSSP